MNHIDHRLALARRIANGQKIVDRNIEELLAALQSTDDDWDRAERLQQTVDRWRLELKELGGS